MFFIKVLKFIVLISTINAQNCINSYENENLKFQLVKFSQRSTAERIFVDNVHNLKACQELAFKHKGLAFNYSPIDRFERIYKDQLEFRDHFWNQPQLYFNCHILQCPENKMFKTMVNDTSFDYFSIYEKPMDTSDYICLPEIGLFVLQTTANTYQNATLNCHHIGQYCGSLAHVASQQRTEALASLVQNYNDKHSFQLKTKIYLAYVGLQYNASWFRGVEFVNSDRESIKYFAYRAWEAGSPKTSGDFGNTSCVALTINRTWRSVKCNRKLPYICEILTSCGEKN